MLTTNSPTTASRLLAYYDHLRTQGASQIQWQPRKSKFQSGYIALLPYLTKSEIAPLLRDAENYGLSASVEEEWITITQIIAVPVWTDGKPVTEIVKKNDKEVRITVMADQLVQFSYPQATITLRDLEQAGCPIVKRVQDIGEPTQVSPILGGTTASVKRAVPYIGIGADLYNFPKVFVTGKSEWDINPIEYLPMLEWIEEQAKRELFSNEDNIFIYKDGLILSAYCSKDKSDEFFLHKVDVKKDDTKKKTRTKQKQEEQKVETEAIEVVAEEVPPFLAYPDANEHRPKDYFTHAHDSFMTLHNPQMGLNLPTTIDKVAELEQAIVECDGHLYAKKGDDGKVRYYIFVMSHQSFYELHQHQRVTHCDDGYDKEKKVWIRGTKLKMTQWS